MKIINLSFVLLLLIGLQLQAQHKQEFRGVWIATVSNLDWPKSAHKGNAELQKQDLRQILDMMVDLKLNAAVFQVRTECDAFYNSAYEPWSRFLSGVQGTDPGYDPLQFAVEEAHKRGIELHAWLNPYRINVSATDGGDYYHSTNVYKEHPEWAITYSTGKRILNPGIPQVTKYIKQVVGDILQKYDVDGIHFDDYFYSYDGTPNALDQATFDTYGQGYSTRGDFRRANINKMVSEVFDTIQKVKPFVRFGISPFGIYGNGMNPAGISGLDSYNTIYCDPFAWLTAGTVDYVNPQLYWPTGGAQDYATLLPFWAQHAKNRNRHVYSGNGTYRLSDSPATKKAGIFKRFIHSVSEIFSKNKSTSDPVATWTLGQLKLQVQINRDNRGNNALGSNFFRYNDFNRVAGLVNYTKSEIFLTKALTPTMTWKTQPSLAVPTNVRLEYDPIDLCNYLKWDYPNNTTRFVVYTEDLVNQKVDINNPDNIYALTYEKRLKLTENFPIPQGICVTALDRNGFESGASAIYGITPPVKPVLSLPANQSIVGKSFSFTWESQTDANSFVLQVSTDAAFNNLVVNANGIAGTSHAAAAYALSGEKTYYWRIAGVNSGGQGVFSDVYTFTTNYPASPVIVNPQHLSTDIALKPLIEWNNVVNFDSIQFQISEGSSAFNASTIVVDVMYKGTGSSFTISKSLKQNTFHFIRAKAYKLQAESNYSIINQFKTLTTAPSKPEITSPANGAVVSTLPLNITWTAAQGATSYLVQVAGDNAFSIGLLQTEIYLATSHIQQSLIKGATYYIRVAGKNAAGVGEWSNTISITTGTTTAVSALFPNKGNLNCRPNPVEAGILTIDYHISMNGKVDLKLFNNKGQCVKELYHGNMRAGQHSLTVDISDLVDDIYFVVLKGVNEETFKIIKK